MHLDQTQWPEEEQKSSPVVATTSAVVVFNEGYGRQGKTGQDRAPWAAALRTNAAKFAI
jgi:hypothetical protein